MPRRLPPDQEFVWRAKVTYHLSSGNTFDIYCGPFTRRNHATASAKYDRRKGDAVITVQRSRLEWEDVETRKETDDREA